MISIKSKLAVALGVVGAIALSVPPAEARTKRSTAKVHRAVTGSHAYQPLGRGSYYYAPAPAIGAINFNDGRNGANYNPNQ